MNGQRWTVRCVVTGQSSEVDVVRGDGRLREERSLDSRTPVTGMNRVQEYRTNMCGDHRKCRVDRADQVNSPF